MHEVQFEFELHVPDIFHGYSKTGERFGDSLLDGCPFSLRHPGNFRPVLLKNPVDPHCHLKYQENDVFFGVMVTRTYRVPFTVRATACIDYMKNCICLPEIVKELVTQSLALVGIRYKPGNIN